MQSLDLHIIAGNASSSGTQSETTNPTQSSIEESQVFDKDLVLNFGPRAKIMMD